MHCLGSAFTVVLCAVITSHFSGKSRSSLETLWRNRGRTPAFAFLGFVFGLAATCFHSGAAPVEAEGQPLAANVARLVQALDFLGAPLPANVRALLDAASRERDSNELQRLLDPHALLIVNVNPEERVKVSRGGAPAGLRQAGYTPVIVKVVNDSSVTKPLSIGSPQSGPVYAGVAKLSMFRQRQEKLRENENVSGSGDRFLAVEMFSDRPMTRNLSGLRVEYAIALIYSSEAGKREATLAFDIGQGTQDLGFRAEVPVLFDIKPAVSVKLRVRDHDGSSTTGRFLFADRLGHVFPPQAKRLAPDFFFQKHIYRADGEFVLLPPGEFTLFYGRGPEYRWLRREIVVPSAAEHEIGVDLKRWIDPGSLGYVCGDHHIHAAGCAHYSQPSVGVEPDAMFRQIKGEGLNVGCVLTWGPGFDHQHKYFSPTADEISEPQTLIKYDIEVSGFGSQALGHVCLINLKEQIYPGAEGHKDWPTWTLPVLKWAKEQGAVTGYAHSGSGLQVDSKAAARRLLSKLDRNRDRALDAAEARSGLLTESFATMDADGNGALSVGEIEQSHERVADQLPNVAIPELNGVGAQEIFVTAALGACDFISAMDTARLLEWNCWYHLLNCGLPIKVSGETDFPCMSGTRVGQGRVYVQLGATERVDFPEWCRKLAEGRSYVSDGYGHAMDFRVNGVRAGDNVELAAPGDVRVSVRIAFSSQTPLEAAYGGVVPSAGRRVVGDTVVLYADRPEPGAATYQEATRIVELVVNGRVAASRRVPADDKIHDIDFSVKIDRSSWVAVRQFPQLHTNPVNVLVAGKPIRASRRSAQWCIDSIEHLWGVRSKRIKDTERTEASLAYSRAMAIYRRIAEEAPQDL